MDSQQDTAVFAPSGEPDEAAVLAYLKAHPDFFIRNAAHAVQTPREHLLLIAYDHAKADGRHGIPSHPVYARRMTVVNLYGFWYNKKSK